MPSSVNTKPVPRDVAQAIAYMRVNLHRNIPMAELAATVGVGERTLREHFRSFMGVSPGDYGTRLRLAAARRALQLAGRTSSVTRIATKYGFSHLGRFSGLYRQAFGEPPSTTRRQVLLVLNDTPSLTLAALRDRRPEVTILTFVAPPPLANVAEAIGSKVATMVSAEVAVSIGSRRDKATSRYLLQGSIIQSGEQLRILVSLIDAASARQVWGDAWDGRAREPLPLIDRIVTVMARSIVSNVRNAEIARVAHKSLEHLEAYELCLRAYPLLSTTTGPAAREALALLYRAMERDPDYALAPGLAAWGHAQLVLQIGSASPVADFEQAQLLSARACALDPDDPIVLTTRGMVQTLIKDHEAGTIAIERALARNPYLSWAWERKGWLKLYSGDAREAIPCFGRALRFDAPTAPRATRFIGIGAAFFDVGDYHLSAKWMERALQVEPGTIWVNRALAVAYERLGERGLAQHSLRALRRYRPGVTVSEVVSSLCFSSDFVARIANGLNDLGLSP